MLENEQNLSSEYFASDAAVLEKIIFIQVLGD